MSEQPIEREPTPAEAEAVRDLIRNVREVAAKLLAEEQAS